MVLAYSTTLRAFVLYNSVLYDTFLDWTKTIPFVLWIQILPILVVNITQVYFSILRYDLIDLLVELVLWIMSASVVESERLINLSVLDIKIRWDLQPKCTLLH